MSFNSLDLNVLKNLITNKKYALDFASEYDAKLFSPELWNTGNVIVGYIKTHKELPTLRVLTEKLSKGTNNTKLIESLTTTWSAIEQTKIDSREYKHDLDKIKHRFAEKQLLASREHLNKLEPGSMDVSKSVIELQKTIQSIKSLDQTKAYTRKTLKDAIATFRDEYNAKLEDPNFDAGIKTGYSYLDYVSDGLRPGELLLIGGESGAGKSMFLMNMAIQMWLQNNTTDMDEKQFGIGNNVLYFSLEMPYKPCLNRVLGRLSSNPTKLIRSAKLNDIQAIKLKKVLKFIGKYPFQFEIVDVPRGSTMEKLELIFEEAKALYNPQIVVIDYLGLMDYEGTDTEDWLKLGKISSSMHEFARVHNLIVLSAVQLNRSNAKTEEERIGMHRIGRSAMIMHNANIALQINKRSGEDKYGDMEYYVIKCRDGEMGKGIVIKDFKCGTLLDHKLENQDSGFDLFNPDDISEQINRLEEDDN